jgi:diguanylate cyclase (GGDEF)-like protein
MGSRYALGDAPMVVGREECCDIRLDEGSVSRRHACIQPEGMDHCIIDLQSTNGTFVNDVRIAAQRLKDGDYLHIGNCICRYLAGGNVEAQYHEEIKRLTIMDALTDIHNRRFLLESLGHALATSARYRRPLAFLIFDVDHFKNTNDRLGHLGGDFTLRELANSLKSIIREEDVLGRYGGEEFGLIMPDSGLEEGLQIGERLRVHAERHPFRYEDVSYRVTVSVGVAAVTGADWVTTHEMIAQADEQLRRAKSEGRNRVCG